MPIALDVIFDHCLARRFEALTGHALEAFSAKALNDLKAQRHRMPPPAQQLLAALDTGVLPAYARWPQWNAPYGPSPGDDRDCWP